MGRIDDHDDLEITTYAPVKAWILQLDVKLKLRKSTRTKTSVKSPDDMVYGVNDAPPPAEQATHQPPSASAADPWYASVAASDP